MKQKNNKVLIVLIILLAIICITISVLLTSFDNSIKDKMYQKASIVSDDIYVIGIDEETLSNYGKFETFNREKLTELINLLNSMDEKPAVIGIDISIFGKQNEEIDSQLVEAVGMYDNVILCSSITMSNIPEKGESIVLYEEPFTELKNKSAGIGFSNLIFDEDGVIRHALKEVRLNDKIYESFDKVVYEKYVEKKNIESNIDKIDNQFYISYTGKSHSYFGSTMAGSSMYSVLEGIYPKEEFSNAIVLIGAYASGMQDNFYTSIEKDDQMYGVEIHANIINQFINGVNKTETNNLTNALIIVSLLVLFIVTLFVANNKIVLLINIIISVIYLVSTQLAYTYFDLALPIVPVLLFEILSIITHIIYQYIMAEIEKKKLIQSYARYLSPELAKNISEKQDSILNLGGQKKKIAVLFVDIRGFTSLSEKTNPEDVVQILNEYFKITTNAILNNGGMIDKFIGDCTMGLFNAMVDTEDYEYKAVCAGLEMVSNSQQLNEYLKNNKHELVTFGIGVHIGEALVGNIGTDFRMDYTAIGDVVNTASRIEANAKSNQLLISEDTYQIVKDRFEINDAGYLNLKGKEKPMHVYEVIKKK